ncbi:hypothetical protein [Maribellus maritimus]|uniref:hypothetical protein n=1 Tax=Maribellus maritimus TaxID=2870838 RepID=UPI001EE9BA42|nr:hypothetical protein [Maribellus maritimus]MCG6189707.1 hypothetical protein [Maribellus maritimus]
MANIDDYNARLSDIKAIPDEETREPGIPVDVALQEAENLHHWSLNDAAALAVVGITSDMINDLPVRAGACREAQSIWNKDYRSQQEAQKEWAEQAPEGYAFRDDLLASLRFAYRKDDALLSHVSAITDGSGHADMIQDLNDIAVLGRENPIRLRLLVSISHNSTWRPPGQMSWLTCWLKRTATKPIPTNRKLSATRPTRI